MSSNTPSTNDGSNESNSQNTTIIIAVLSSVGSSAALIITFIVLKCIIYYCRKRKLNQSRAKISGERESGWDDVTRDRMEEANRSLAKKTSLATTNSEIERIIPLQIEICLSQDTADPGTWYIKSPSGVLKTRSLCTQSQTSTHKKTGSEYRISTVKSATAQLIRNVKFKTTEDEDTFSTFSSSSQSDHSHVPPKDISSGKVAGPPEISISQATSSSSKTIPTSEESSYEESSSEETSSEESSKSKSTGSSKTKESSSSCDSQDTESSETTSSSSTKKAAALFHKKKRTGKITDSKKTQSKVDSKDVSSSSGKRGSPLSIFKKKAGSQDTSSNNRKDTDTGNKKTAPQGSTPTMKNKVSQPVTCSQVKKTDSQAAADSSRKPPLQSASSPSPSKKADPHQEKVSGSQAQDKGASSQKKSGSQPQSNDAFQDPMRGRPQMTPPKKEDNFHQHKSMQGSRVMDKEKGGSQNTSSSSSYDEESDSESEDLEPKEEKSLQEESDLINKANGKDVKPQKEQVKLQESQLKKIAGEDTRGPINFKFKPPYARTERTDSIDSRATGSTQVSEHDTLKQRSLSLLGRHRISLTPDLEEEEEEEEPSGIPRTSSLTEYEDGEMRRRSSVHISNVRVAGTGTRKPTRYVVTTMMEDDNANK